MKRIFTILMLLLSFAGINSKAQTTTCNAAFATTYQNGNTVQFIPAYPGTPNYTFHFWNFGDGATSPAISPVHTYTSGSFFLVQHVMYIFVNGAIICSDTVYMNVQVQNPCNLTSGFYSFRDSLVAIPNPPYHFINTTNQQNPTDSVRWTFGDGTSSNVLNPIHTYAQPGTYTVCLRVQQRTNTGALSNCVSEICHPVVVPNPTVCNLVANFTFTQLAGAINTYSFQNTSVPLNSTDSIRWTFGDGTSSNNLNPTHTFTQPGTYNVCLRIMQRNSNGSLSNCIREKCVPIIVQNTTVCNLVANFTFTPATTSPNTFYFQNTSTPLNTTDSIRWTFGDGTFSNQSNTVHSYAQPGTYNVCLRVQQRTANGTLSNCIREVCHTVIVQNTTVCNLIANFTTTPVTATPTAFHFVNTSTPLNPTDSVRWTFGDGTFSNDMNPSHTYAQAGTYNVCIRVQQRNPNGTLTNCIREKCLTLVVQNTTVCNLVANFTFTPVATSPNTFYFQNTSTPLNTTDSIRWTFGDGTSSNQSNTVHSYAQPGTYTVCLRIIQRTPNGTLSNCIREICHTVIVQNSTVCNLIANFTTTPVTATPTAFHFVNTSTPLNPTDSVRWTFGDGTSSNDLNPTHTYAQAGTYTVCLRVQQRNPNGVLTNCIREKCLVLVVQNTTVCNLVANFSTTVSPASPNTFYFQNTSTPLNATDSVRWAFGDGTSSNTSNTVHTYTQPGTYTVCLRVQQRTPNGTLSNCIREICHTIIVQNSTTCNLVANFTFTLLQTAPNTYHFQNTSTPLNANDSIKWTFGDGTSSNQVNPNHTFAQPGTYNVCLRVQQRTSSGALSNCIREKCMTIYVQTTTACNLTANFYSYRDTVSITPVAFLYHFVNTSSPLNNTDSIRWTFGDGSSSNQVSPAHVYAQPGTYYVCLRIQKRNSNGTLTNCVREICRYVYVGQVNPTNSCFIQTFPNPATTIVNLNVYLSLPQMIDVYFYNYSNTLIREKHQPGVVGNNTVSVSIASLPTGIYRMKVVRGNMICYSSFVKL